MFPSDVNHAPLQRKGTCTLDQLVALRPVLQPLLQAVGDLLALELLLDGLQRPAVRWHVSFPEGSFGAKTHGAAFVSSRMCLFFRSWASGRAASRFSSSALAREGEMGDSSTATSRAAAVSSSGADMLLSGVPGVFARNWSETGA
jgi:hypothetical protein